MPNPSHPIPPTLPPTPGPSRRRFHPAPLLPLALAPLLLACLVLLAHSASAQLPAVSTGTRPYGPLLQHATAGGPPTPTPICVLGWQTVSSPSPSSTNNGFW